MGCIILAILTGLLSVLNIWLWYPDGKTLNLIAAFMNMVAMIVLLTLREREQ